MSLKVGLALGGGAARGLAHLGVIKALQDAKIPIDIISGASVGSIIGSIYCACQDAYEAISLVDSYVHSPDYNKTRLDFIRESDQEVHSYLTHFKKVFKTSYIFAVSMRNTSFISENTLKNNLKQIIPDKKIEDCAVKLGLVCMDLDSAEEIVFFKGNMIDRVMASCAIPGVFPPMKLGGRMLIDGSWVNPVPVSVAKKMGADIIIAVDVAPYLSDDVKGRNGWDILLRSSEGARLALKNYSLQHADFVISLDLMDIHWADFTQIKKCVQEGELITKQYIDKIKKRILWKKIKPRFF